MSGGGWQGMDVAVVEQQARQLQTLAEQTKSLIAKVDGEIRRLGENWHGDDARKFASDWDGQHKQALTQAATILEHMSQSATQQAAQQKSTSSH